MQFKKPATAGSIAFLLLLPLAAWSGGVVTNCTETNLRAALAGGGTVTFACDGTITLSSTITNAVSTTLDASGHQITISGGNVVRVFYVATNTTLTLINLAVADGNAVTGAGIFNGGGNLILLGTAFLTNSAHHGFDMGDFPFFGCGGGIFSRGGTVNATNCTFMGNRAQLLVAVDPMIINPAKGGAIHNVGGQMNLRQCNFTDNHATGSPGTSPATGPGSRGNDGLGGAIYNAGGLSMNDCTLQRNSVTGGLGGTSPPLGGCHPGLPGASGGNADGGAVWNSGILGLGSCSFESNSVVGGVGGTGGSGGSDGTFGGDGGAGGPGGVGRGGALFNSGTASLANCSFGPGSVATGGNAGNAVNGVNATYAGSGGTGGVGGSGSGSALCNQGTLTMANCTVASSAVTGGNGGSGGAGGTGVKSGGLGGNGGNGGGGLGVIWSSNGLFLTNCTIAMNFATSGTGGSGGAGGINTYPPIIQQLSGVAGTNGFAVGGMKGLNSRLVNTILATNVPGGNCSGSITDAGHNLSSDGSCAFTNVGSLNNTDPKLGPLADNGGPTLTMALLASSPAIDVGESASAPATDQRGFPRAGLAADIGAFEYGSMLPFLSITRSGSNGVGITAYGPSGQSCRLLTSTNLSDWECVATNQLGPNGTVLFQENCGTGETKRFYKVALP